jgi:hypothetical protein
MADLTVEELEAFDKKVEDLKESFKDAEYVKKYGDALKGLFATLETEGLEKATIAFDKLALSMELGLPSAEKFGKALERSIKTFTGVTDASNTLVGSFFKLARESDDLSSVTDKMKEVYDETFSALNVGTSIVRKMMESTFAMAKANDQATAAFNKSSGAAGAYDKELVALQQSNIANGLSAADMGESYRALQNSLSGFGVMAESERMRLGELGAEFAAIGVSGGDFAGTLQTMTRTLGMSTQAATGMQKEAMALAQTLGKDVGTVMSELNQALPKLAAYGDDATQMFGELQKAAQRTGLEIGELMDMTSRYDTFDSAATAAGNLNAVLDTQSFGTMEFLESVREGGDSLTNYLTDTLQASGVAWESMDYFQRKAIANAADMDVATMSNLMNAEAQTKQEKDRAETLDKTMAKGRSLWEELTIFAQNFAIAVTPIVEWLTIGIQGINGALGYMNEHLGFIMQTIKIIGTLWAGAFAIGQIKRAIGWIKKLTIFTNLQTAADIARKSVMGPVGWGILAAGAGIAAVAVAKMIKKGNAYADGTDATTARNGEPILVGEEGPELLVTPPNSAVVNNTTMTALAEQGAGGGGDNAQVVAAVQALGAKLDTMITKLGGSGDFVMQVDRQEFGRVINNHFGEEGSAPLRLKA